MLKQRLCLLAVLFPAAVFAVTIDQLREAVSDDTAAIKQMHVVYVMENKDDSRTRQAAQAMNELSKKLDSMPSETASMQPSLDTLKLAMQTESSQQERIESFIDIEALNFKQITTDLRDIPKLLKEKNLPPKQKMNVCRTKTILTNSDYTLELAPAENFDSNTAHALLKAKAGSTGIAQIKSLGILPYYYLTEACNPVLSEQEDGNIAIKTTHGKQDELETVHLCDPSVDYRVHSTKKYKEGVLVQETTLEDYRIINKIPFPFRYEEKRFDKDGNVLSEKQYTIEQVKLNQQFPPDIFKVMIPDGTQITDFVVSGAVYKLHEGGLWSIDELLDIAEKRAGTISSPTPSDCRQSNP